MIHTPENCKDKILVDCWGTEIPGVLSFDDETFEVELMIIGKNEKLSPKQSKTLVVSIPVVADLSGCHPVGKFKSLTIKTVIPGAKLVGKEEV